MYYKIEKESELGLKIKAIYDLAEEIHKENVSLCLEIGAEPEYLNTSSYIAGGLQGFIFKQKPDMEKFRIASKEYPNAYFPRAKYKDLIGKVKKLRSLDWTCFNCDLNFKSQGVSNHRGIYFIRHPSVLCSEKYFLVEVNNACEYEPVQGMAEILASEWKELCETVKDN